VPFAFADLQSKTLIRSIPGSAHVLATALRTRYLYFTRYGDSLVYAYDTTTFQLLPPMTFSGLGSVLLGLATSDAVNYLYIADMYYSCVHRVDLSVTSTVSKISWSAPRGHRVR